MKFARCECRKCNKEFLITFDNNIPPYVIHCVLCTSPDVKVTWIDRAEIRKDVYVDEVVDPNI